MGSHRQANSEPVAMGVPRKESARCEGSPKLCVGRLGEGFPEEVALIRACKAQQDFPSGQGVCVEAEMIPGRGTEAEVVQGSGETAA